MKLADFVISYLRDIGIKQVFQVYGAATGDLIDAFSRIKGIEYICTIHEQCASFAVEAQAKVTNHIQCCMATSGPGGINVLNGVANCYYDSVPCLYLTGQINSKFQCKDKAQRQTGFQENDIVSMAKPITKYAVMVTKPEDIKYELQKAVYLATHGRQSPVLVDIPVDVQKSEIEPDKLREFEHPSTIDNYNIDKELYGGKYGYQEFVYESLIKDLQTCKRPAILVGGGVWWAKASDLVRELGQKLKMPCFPTWNATDIITSDYEYYGGRVGTFGGDGRNFAIQNSDLLLAIGTRISGRITGGYVESFARKAKKYIVDIDPAMLKPENQQVKGDVNLCSDAKLFIERLLDRIGDLKFDYDLWWQQVKEWRDKYKPCLSEYYKSDYVHPYVFIRELSKVCKSGDIIFCDSGGNAVATFQNFDTKYGQRLLSSNGNSTMGQSFSEALGVSFLPEYYREQKGRVICISGDGGFQMNIQDLQTVKHYGLRLKMFVLNNHSYGITHQYQQTNFGSRFLASGGENGDGYSVPDFCNIALAYGLKTIRLNSMVDLAKNIEYILSMPEAIVVDVNCCFHSVYEPRISGWKTPIEDMTPLLSRKEFRRNMIIEPVEGWDKVNGDSNSMGLA